MYSQSIPEEVKQPVERAIKVSAPEASDDTGITNAISRDIRLGRITGRLTFGTVKNRYGLKVDSRIRKVFTELENRGLLIKKGKSYYASQDSQSILKAVSG